MNKLTRSAALAILADIGATATCDFHTLRSSQVDDLLVYADVKKYKKPANANGSRGRYFFAYVQRAANQRG